MYLLSIDTFEACFTVKVQCFAVIPRFMLVERLAWPKTFKIRSWQRSLMGESQVTYLDLDGVLCAPTLGINYSFEISDAETSVLLSCTITAKSKTA